MTEKQEKFSEEAVSTLADAMEESNNENKQKVGQSRLLESIAEVSNFYQIPTKDRTEFAVKGLERLLEREKQSVISDFREQLESLGRIWERKDE